VIFPIVYASFGFPAAASAIAVGKEVPSSSRIAVPRSKSAPISSGSLDFASNWIAQHCRRIRLALQKSKRRALGHIDEAADMQILNVVHQLGISCGIRGRETAVIRSKQELSNFFLDAHLLQRRFHPLAGVFR